MAFDWMQVAYALIGAFAGTFSGAYLGFAAAKRVDRQRAIEDATAKAIAAARVMVAGLETAKPLKDRFPGEWTQAVLPLSAALTKANSIAGSVTVRKNDELRLGVFQLHRLMHEVVLQSQNPLAEYNQHVSVLIDSLEDKLRARR